MARSGLPIDAHLARIVESLEANPNLVIVAEPGAGKTTRVPPALAEAPFVRGGAVWVLEPRRMAARLSAQRVADELGEPLGRRVGYAVRFERKRSSATRVMFVTEALLVRQLLEDPTLRGVSAVVLDEFHERSIHTDLALALLRGLQRTARPDLRLVVMSATLDAEPLARHLNAPVLEASGRPHAVEIQHLEAEDDRPLATLVQVALRRTLLREMPGDVLVFLPGAAEIRRALAACRDLCESHRLEACMLHGDLPAREQDRVLAESTRRKVIFSTNIAETSVTLPRVGVVIDSGFARVAGCSPWSGLPTLDTAPISQASAVQRAGRAGRVRAGVCQRLYTRANFTQRQAFDVPELRRADLAETRLWVAALARGQAIEWFEPPPEAAWNAASELLRALGALDAEGRPTQVGERMLRMPVHPRLARVALAAAEQGFAHEGATLAALLGERDVRSNRRLGREAPDDHVADSDVLEQLEWFEALAGDCSAENARRHGLDAHVVRAVARGRDRLARSLPDAALGELPREHALLRAVLLGYPDRVAARRRPREPDIVFAAGGSGVLAPHSAVKEASWMVAVGASQQRGKVVVRAASAVEPDWLFEVLFDQLREDDALRFDPEKQRVERVRKLRLGQLSLEEQRSVAEPSEAATRVLVEALRQAGPRVPWNQDAMEQLRRRAAFAARFDASVPSLEDDSLAALIARHAEGCVSFDELRAMPLEQTVPSLLGEAWTRLEQLAPAHCRLPSGRRLTIHYEWDRPPWVKSRLQDFFGMREGPRVAAGREALVLHLLAPNQRPVQVTTDLAGFWQRHYPTLRRELMRRYPRHAWPEDGLA